MADAAGLLQQAQEAVKAQDYAGALELYYQALDVAPTAEALAGRAQVHNKMQNYMEAAADANSAIELDDKLAAAHKEKGNAFYNLEEYESAMDAFEAASQLEPTKNIHKTWVNMCRVQLGEELPPVPTRPFLPPTQSAAPIGDGASTSAGGSGSSGSGSGKGLSLSGDQLKAFLEQAKAGNLAGALGGQRAGGPPPEAEEEAGTAKPQNVLADDPEFSKYWKQPLAASMAASIPSKPAGAKYRHQWFQSPERVEVDVLAKGLKKDQVEVAIEAQRLRVTTTSADGQQEYELDLPLHAPVVPEGSRFEVLGTKIEIKLQKAAAGRQWLQLEQEAETVQESSGAAGEGSSAPLAAAAGVPVAAAGEPAGAAAASVTEALAAAAAPAPSPAKPTPAYPYAGKKVDWDKVAQDIKKEEKEEKLEGDQALMKFFRELYDGGDEETQRAMVKSMQESGGTALSMNWGEVGKKDYTKKGKDGEDEDEDKEWGRKS